MAFKMYRTRIRIRGTSRVIELWLSQNIWLIWALLQFHGVLTSWKTEEIARPAAIRCSLYSKPLYTSQLLGKHWALSWHFLAQVLKALQLTTRIFIHRHQHRWSDRKQGLETMVATQIGNCPAINRREMMLGHPSTSVPLGPSEMENVYRDI